MSSESEAPAVPVLPDEAITEATASSSGGHGGAGEPPLSYQFIGGVMSGLGVVAVGHPFDIIKTRLQIDGQSSVRKYKGPADAFSSLVRNEGLLAFYKGVRAPLTATPFIYSISFGTWGIAEHFLVKWGYTEPKPDGDGVQLTIPGLFMTGAFSGACQSTVFVPSEMVKKRLMAQDVGLAEAKYKGMIDCAKQVTKERGGIKALYVGYPMVLCAYTPAVALWYGTYGYARRKLNPDPRNPSALRTILAGGIAGWVAWGVMFPFDTIGSRLQTAEKGQYKGGLDAIRKLHAENGLRGFYNGFVPCMLRAFPADGALFLVYEVTIKVLKWGFGD